MRRLVLTLAVVALAAACARDETPPTSAPQPTTSVDAGPTPTSPLPTFGIPTDAIHIAEKVEVQVGDKTVLAEVADDPMEIRTGLMFRDALPEDAGMLFLLPSPQTAGFWMKNTRVPLSIAYMKRLDDSTFEIVSIRDMEPCRTETCQGYPPEPAGTAYTATLEVNQGYFADAGVEVGDEIATRE